MGEGSGTIRVLVADAQRLFAEALARVLQLHPSISAVEQYPTSGLDGIKAVAATKPDVVLFDLWMPDMEGTAAVSQITGRDPATKVVVMSWFHGAREIEKALDAGAVGFFPKSIPVDRVTEGVIRAHAGESPVYLEELERLTRRISRKADQTDSVAERLKVLSPREMEILVNLGLDLSLKQIAETLSISPATVKNHIHNIISKTGTRSSKEVVAMARGCGLIR